MKFIIKSVILRIMSYSHRLSAEQIRELKKGCVTYNVVPGIIARNETEEEWYERTGNVHYKKKLGGTWYSIYIYERELEDMKKYIENNCVKGKIYRTKNYDRDTICAIFCLKNYTLVRDMIIFGVNIYPGVLEHFDESKYDLSRDYIYEYGAPPLVAGKKKKQQVVDNKQILISEYFKPQ